MLVRLEVERFRGVRDARVDGLTQLNLFLGPNGCGKSTLLEAIELAASAFAATDPLGEDRLGGLKRGRNEQGVEEGAGSALPRGWWHGRDTSRPVVVRGETSSGSFEHAFAWGEETVGRSAAVELSFWSRLLRLDAGRALTGGVERHLWEGAFLAGQHVELRRLLSSIYGVDVRALTFTAGQDLLVDLPPHPLRLDDLGAGMRVAFRVLLAGLRAGRSALLLDDIDAGQHPASGDELARALCAIAARDGVQLFLATHRLETVQAFLHAAAPRPAGWCRVFPVERAADGRLRARGLDRDDALALLDCGLDLRELAVLTPLA